MLTPIPQRTWPLLGLLVILPWLLAPSDSLGAELENWSASFSASFHLPDAGSVLRRQFLQDDLQSASVFPGPGVLPVHSRPNAYARLDSGHHLLSFAHSTSYPGAPRALFRGDVIEVDAGFAFQSFRLDALSAAGFDRRLNVNAVTIDPANPSHLLISLAHSATIGSEPYLPADIIRFDGNNFFLHFDGVPLAGRNINALDAYANAAGTLQGYILSFESGGSIGGISYSSNDLLSLSIGSGGSWSIFDQPSERNAELWGRQKLQALAVTFKPVVDRIFSDRFAVD